MAVFLPGLMDARMPTPSTPYSNTPRVFWLAIPQASATTRPASLATWVRRRRSPISAAKEVRAINSPKRRAITRTTRISTRSGPPSMSCFLVRRSCRQWASMTARWSIYGQLVRVHALAPAATLHRAGWARAFGGKHDGRGVLLVRKKAVLGSRQRDILRPASSVDGRWKRRFARGTPLPRVFRKCAFQRTCGQSAENKGVTLRRFRPKTGKTRHLPRSADSTGLKRPRSYLDGNTRKEYSRW